MLSRTYRYVLQYTSSCYISSHREYAPDVKADNLLFGIDDKSVFDVFEQEELETPGPRKVLDDRIIYTSRRLSPRGYGPPVLCHFGSAVAGDVQHLDDIQPDIYRSPEVILEVSWTCHVDTWNVGCMVESYIALIQHGILIRCGRFGPCLRADTCLLVEIRYFGRTKVGLTLQR